MSLPARYQHHQPLGARPRHPTPSPGRQLVRALSTKRMPAHARHRLQRHSWWGCGPNRSARGAFLRWDAELFAGQSMAQ